MQRSSCSIFAILLTCCSGQSATDGPTTDAGRAPEMDASVPARDGGVTAADAGAAPDSGPAGDAGAPTGDGNEGFGSAENLPWGVSAGLRRVIGTPGDRDYFRFEAEAGEWLWVQTEGNEDRDPAKIDTVVTLFDPQQRQIARSDDLYPAANQNSRIWTRIASSGTHYLEVQDYSTFGNGPPRGSDQLTYTVWIRRPDPTNAFVVEDAELGDDAQAASTEPEYTQASLLVLGTFDRPGDVDVFRFPVRATGGLNLLTAVMPQGADGYGATDLPAQVRVQRARDGARLAISAPPIEGAQVYPPVAAGEDVELWVEHRGPSLGANPFYVLSVVASPRGRAEVEDVSGATDTAELLEGWTIVEGGLQRYFDTHLEPGDVDVYTGPELPPGGRVSVSCASRSLGGALVNLQVELLDDLGAVVAEALEDPSDGLSIPFTAVQTPSFFLRLSSEGALADHEGHWASCGAAISQ